MYSVDGTQYNVATYTFNFYQSDRVISHAHDEAYNIYDCMLQIPEHFIIIAYDIKSYLIDTVVNTTRLMPYVEMYMYHMINLLDSCLAIHVHGCVR